MSDKLWCPLESNPEVLNDYVKKLGWTNEKIHFTDVYSTEDWALEMIPKPCHALMLLYPLNEVTEKFRNEENKKITTDGQILSENIFFTKQTIENACGTIGVLHAIGNLPENLRHESITKDSFLERFYKNSLDMSPEKIAEYLEGDNELEECHEEAAETGQTEAVSEVVNTHFICFAPVDGHIYEFDGRKAFPINHGPTSESTFLEDAVNVVKGFMARQPDEMRFTMVALVQGTEEE